MTNQMEILNSINIVVSLKIQEVGQIALIHNDKREKINIDKKIDSITKIKNKSLINQITLYRKITILVNPLDAE